MINFRPDINLEDLLPAWYKAVADYQQICSAERGVYEIAADAIDTVHGNFYIANMTAAAIDEWEKTLSIVTIPGETLDFRRTRLLNRLGTRPPFTVAFLRERLDALIGAGNYEITLDAENYTFYVEASAYDQSYATEVTIMINDIKPAHMVYINKPYTNDAVNVSEEVAASRLTYNVVLGSYGLGSAPFVSAGRWEVEKMAQTPSVQSALLNGAAEWLKGDVVKARINGSTVITDITKTRNNGTLTIEYTVLASAVSEVNSIELLDASNNVLTSAEVYVPIAQNTTFKHVIPFTEG